MFRRLLHCLLSLLILFVLLTGALWLTHPWWLGAMGRWLVVDQQPVASDAIVAVSGQHRRRTFAIELYKRGYAPRLIFNVSDTTWYFGEPIDPVASVKDDLAEAGVPVGRATVHSGIQSTWQDAETTLADVRRLGLRSLIVVSSPLHMRRTAMTYESVLADTGVRLTFCSVPLERDKIDLHRWWTREREFLKVYNEYLKLVYYCFAHLL